MKYKYVGETTSFFTIFKTRVPFAFTRDAAFSSTCAAHFNGTHLTIFCPLSARIISVVSDDLGSQPIVAVPEADRPGFNSIEGVVTKSEDDGVPLVDSEACEVSSRDAQEEMYVLCFCFRKLY